jgi:hypothetical protein
MTTSSAHSSSSFSTGQVFLYLSPLTLLIYLTRPHAYLSDIATSFMLKNQLHATASQVSLFRLLTAVPVYLSFAFGTTRDLRNPLSRRVRGYFLVFAPATAVVFREGPTATGYANCKRAAFKLETSATRVPSPDSPGLPTEPSASRLIRTTTQFASSSCPVRGDRADLRRSFPHPRSW